MFFMQCLFVFNICLFRISVEFSPLFFCQEYGWGLERAMDHVKKKRDCITPNKGFVEQLKIFEGKS